MTTATRIFLANIIAGGIGTNLTAATQVVFNDLDWVPANHWQAEDRAYRIGQTRTVNVTYMVAADTMDDFVQSVLEKKGALVKAVVDGKALAPELSGDVLDELQRALRAVSSGFAESAHDRQRRRFDRAVAAAGPVGRRRESDEHDGRAARTPEETEALKRALESLARALRAPAVERYRFASTTQPGVEYELTIDGADVICNCRGFEYRGQCRHARDLKTALAEGQAVPAGYRPAPETTKGRL